MRALVCLGLGLMPMAGLAQPQDPAPTASETARPSNSTSAPVDPSLASLIRETLDRNPELARSIASAEADRERVPQARALSDPNLSLGIQNDGFKRLQIGQMETSFYQVMFSQPLPWPGKRGLRGEVAGIGADIATVRAERTRLSLQADVKRAYFGLLLVRGQLRLLEDQAHFLKNAQAITQARYEVGQGSQADILRAQLELSRLNQKRFALQAEDRVFVAALNRLRGIADDAPIPTTASLEHLQFQAPPIQEALALAQARSPELQAARLGTKQAERSLDLAKRDRYPDFAVSGGVMPRGGLDPMWSVGFSIALPLWSKQKQQRAVAEQDWRRRSQGSEAENVLNLLNQRTRERSAQLDAALGIIKIYRDGLLVQSEADFHATLAQYETGRVPFLSALETLNGWVADRAGLLQAVAQAEAILIADEEVNLSGTPAINGQGLAAGSLRAGAIAAGIGSAPSAKPGGLATGDSSSSSASMSGM